MGGPRLGMQKWWYAYVRSNGFISETMSPYHSYHLRSLVKDAGYKITKKITGNFADSGPGLLFGVAVYYFGKAGYEANQRALWD